MTAAVPALLLLLPAAIERLAAVAEPWQSLYSNSAPVATAVLFVHLAALVVGGGLALAADRGTLRAWRGAPEDRARHLADLGLTHSPVLGALGAALGSGILLFLADVEAYAASPLYWAKMALVALLLANGFAMTRVERALSGGRAAEAADERSWRRLRANAVLSAVLWLTTLLAGTALTAG